MKGELAFLVALALWLCFMVGIVSYDLGRDRVADEVCKARGYTEGSWVDGRVVCRRVQEGPP